MPRRYRRWPSHRAWRDRRYGRKIYMTPERQGFAAMFQLPSAAGALAALNEEAIWDRLDETREKAAALKAEFICQYSDNPDDPWWAQVKQAVDALAPTL